MTKHAKFLGTTLALAMLAACGGGGSSSNGTGGTGGGPDGGSSLIPPADEPSLVVDADTGTGTSRTIADVFASDGSLFMRDVSRASVTKRYDAATNYRFIEGQVSVKAEGNDLIVTMRADDSSTPYIARIPNANTINREGITIRISPTQTLTVHTRGDGTIADLFTGTRYARRLDVVLSAEADNFAFDTIGVIGTETLGTRIDALATSNATASYTGTARMNIRDINQRFDDFNATAVGALTLNANFGARTINGAVNTIRVSVNEGAFVNEAGSIQLNPATITGNSFEGTMTPSGTSDLVGAAATGNYSGAFYGPNAEEVGGAMTGVGSVGSTTFIGYGHFSGQ